MARDPLSPSANPSHDSDSDPEDDEFEEVDGDEQVAVDAENQADSDEDNEVEPKPEEEADESSEKTGSPVRGLDYGSDADSVKTAPSPSPSPSDYIVKENSESKKKRAAGSEPVSDKNELKKSKKEKKKKAERENTVAAVIRENLVSEDKAKRSIGLRIWGPEDELMIVKGMIDYKEKNGVDFNSNLDAFYQFIKGQLIAVVDKTQLVNKIRKLKEKFRDNAAKEGNDGELVFSKTHEAEVYEYSKNVWGGKAVRSKAKHNKEKEVSVDVPQTVIEVDNVLALPVPDIELSKKEVIDGSDKSASRVQMAVKKTKVVQKMFVEDDVKMNDSVIPMPVIVDNMMLEKGLELVEKSKLDALNEKWTKYQMDAAELYVRRLDLIKEQTELILVAMKSNP